MKVFKENRIIVVCLFAHTSRRKQPLDYLVFYLYKTTFLNDLNKRTIVVKDEKLNDVYTICVLPTIFYNRATTPQNICSGFFGCRLWDYQKQDVYSDVIKETDLTNFENHHTYPEADTEFLPSTMTHFGV